MVDLYWSLKADLTGCFDGRSGSWERGVGVGSRSGNGSGSEGWGFLQLQEQFQGLHHPVREALGRDIKSRTLLKGKVCGEIKEGWVDRW